MFNKVKNFILTFNCNYIFIFHLINLYFRGEKGRKEENFEIQIKK